MSSGRIGWISSILVAGILLSVSSLQAKSDLRLDGYVRSLIGTQEPDYTHVTGAPEQRGVHAGIGRLKWSWNLANDIQVNMHNRFSWNLVSDTRAFGQGLGTGLGTSRTPGRSVDLQTDLVEKDRYQLTHGLDRLALRLYRPNSTVVLGRQAISWGKANIFPVSDLWVQFSPFELDTETKRGIDAARVLYYPSVSTEVDVVAADRGDREDFSYGLLIRHSQQDLNGYAGAGKFWDEAAALGGITYIGDRLKYRLEATQLWNIDTSDALAPRLTAGIDYLTNNYSFTMEYHYNGTGAGKTSGYDRELRDPIFQRGENYYLGKEYLGFNGKWKKWSRTDLILQAVMNLQDRSYLVAPRLEYEIHQNTILSAGAFLPEGDAPTIVPVRQLNSEFGTYETFYFLELANYF